MKISIAYLEQNNQYLLTPDSHIRSSFLQRKMGRVRESEDRLHMEGCDGDTVSKVQSIASRKIARDLFAPPQKCVSPGRI